MNLDSALTEQIAAELEASGIRLTSNQVNELLEGRYALVGKIIEWGADDTEVRDLLLNLLSDALLGESWPTFGDTQNGRNFEAFTSRLWAAAKVKDLQVISG